MFLFNKLGLFGTENVHERISLKKIGFSLIDFLSKSRSGLQSEYPLETLRMSMRWALLTITIQCDDNVVGAGRFVRGEG